MPNLTLVSNPVQDTRSLVQQLAQEQANQVKDKNTSNNAKSNLLVSIPIYAHPDYATPIDASNLFYLLGTDFLNPEKACFIPTPDIGRLSYVTSLNLGLNIGMAFPMIGWSGVGDGIGGGANIAGFTTDFDIDMYFNLSSIPGNLHINKLFFNSDSGREFVWQDKIGTLMYRNTGSTGGSTAFFGFLPANANNTISSYYNKVYDITSNQIDGRSGGFQPDNQFRFTIEHYNQILNTGKNMLYSVVLNGDQFNTLTSDQKAFLQGQQTAQNGSSPLKSMSFVGQLYFNYIGMLASY